MGRSESAELEYIKTIQEAPIMFRIVSIESSSPHWHYEYEVLFALRGSVVITCETGAFTLGQGDLLLLNSREIHSVISGEKDNLCLFMQWNPALLLDVYDSVFRFNLNTRGKDRPLPESISLFRSALAEIGLLLYEKPDGYQFAIKSGLYRFISLLFNAARYEIAGQDEITAASRHLEDFDQIQRYIRDHFKEEMAVDQLCSGVAMSRAKVFRALKASGAASVKDIQKFYRVEYAKNLLAGSSLSIPSIAAESGFESDSSFYRVFKELTGRPPNQYRASPGEKAAPPGIQGYASYRPPEAARILREYKKVSVTFF